MKARFQFDLSVFIHGSTLSAAYEKDVKHNTVKNNGNHTFKVSAMIELTFELMGVPILARPAQIQCWPVYLTNVALTRFETSMYGTHISVAKRDRPSSLAVSASNTG